MKVFTILISMLVMSAIAPAQAVISVTPPALTHDSRQALTLSVEISGVTDLYASSITLEFNNEVILCTGFQKGTFLEGNAGGSSVHYQSYPEPDAGADYFRVDQTILGTTTCSGSGTLFTVQFIPLKGDEVMVSVRSAQLRNADNEPIAFTTASSLVTINIVALRLKAMLEGAFSGTSMRTDLLSVLPLAQPFTTAPWNYAGSETVPADFFSTHTDIVDWVLVELRDNPTASSVKGRCAALLRSDGMVVGTDGGIPVYVSAPHHMPYYLVVRHRNHLPIMSANAQWPDFSEDVYDFSSAVSQAYGMLPMKQLDSGVWGMIAGEANGDGRITGTDYNAFSSEFFSIASGYRQTDFNLDAMVTGTDYNIFYDNFFTIRISGVPE